MELFYAFFVTSVLSGLFLKCSTPLNSIYC